MSSKVFTSLFIPRIVLNTVFIQARSYSAHTKPPFIYSNTKFSLMSIWTLPKFSVAVSRLPERLVPYTAYSTTCNNGDQLGSLTEIRLPILDFAMLKGPKAKFTVSIEGNIGSGKSTLLKYFDEFQDVEVLQEPVHKWRDVRGYNLLDLMYKDPCRWAYTFQAYVQKTMLEIHLKPTSAPVKLIERSLFSARYCFVENLYQGNKISNPEYAVYCEWFNMISNNLDVSLDLIVYLRTDPSKLHERIQKRARKEEQTIPLQYLEDLHHLHEEWLIEKKYGVHCPVLTLDANDTLAAMHKKFEEHTSEILCQKLAKLPKEEEGEVLASNSCVVASASN